MHRKIWVQVDRTTWPAHPAFPTYPTSFPTKTKHEDFDIPAVLLMIGLLTTPSHSSGVSLSDYWAWVRYLHAISGDMDLRLTKAFADLDAHQKTILSDDFGMGISMFWLLDRLQLGPICDGRYFIDRVAASVGAVAAKTGKQGPNKSPDFVAQDGNGVWHVIECKGTQSGYRYSDRQLGEPGPPPVGGMAQKRTITFPTGFTGQRLACGLAIGVQGGREPSRLKVTDPPGKSDFSVSIDQLIHAEDAILRATTAKSLRIAGFEATSSVISAPAGFSPSARPGKGRAEKRRREVVKEKDARSREELKARTSRRQYTVMGETYRGRQVELDLPASLIVDGRQINSVRIRQGVNASVLNELAGQPVVEQQLIDVDTPWREAVGATKTESDRFSALLRIGSLFISEIELKS